MEWDMEESGMGTHLLQRGNLNHLTHFFPFQIAYFTESWNKIRILGEYWIMSLAQVSPTADSFILIHAFNLICPIISRLAPFLVVSAPSAVCFVWVLCDLLHRWSDQWPSLTPWHALFLISYCPNSCSETFNILTIHASHHQIITS